MTYSRLGQYRFQRHYGRFTSTPRQSGCARRRRFDAFSPAPLHAERHAAASDDDAEIAMHALLPRKIRHGLAAGCIIFSPAAARPASQVNTVAASRPRTSRYGFISARRRRCPYCFRQFHHYWPRQLICRPHLYFSMILPSRSGSRKAITKISFRAAAGDTVCAHLP